MGSRDQRRRDRAQLAATLAARRIDRADHELLTFAIKWLPYGGGPDDEILVNFGLTKQRYLDRLRDVVDRQLDHIHPQTAARLLRFCDDAAPSARVASIRTPRAAAREPLRARPAAAPAHE